MEQAINETATTTYELQHIVQSCVESYGDVYPQREFEFISMAGQAYVEGAEELIAQLLDKLVDNAVSFSKAGSRITLQLERHADEYCLSVTNEGELLPEEMQEQLFDSLVSVRPANRDRPHLGLGLYIAELIAKFHRGRMQAENLADRSGVRISVLIPHAR
jgi:K+-sensing histidine kinase KdpD